MVCSMEYPRCGFAVRYEHDPRGIFRRFHALRGIGVCEDKKTDTQNLSVGLSVTML